MVAFGVRFDGGDTFAARLRGRGILDGEALVAAGVIGAGAGELGFVTRFFRSGIFDG